MASAAVMTAMEARATTYWTATAIYTANGRTTTPPDGAGYLYIEYPMADEEIGSIGDPGNNLYREEGVVRFVFFVPEHANVQYWVGQLDTFRANFRSKRFGTDLAIRTAAPTPVTEPIESGNYIEIATAVPYWYWLVG